ncbi:MAG: hypothetical protein JJD92_07085, partial [Frankiaceae bacterium]|nr:hypothetical protein [Frankiaceae bacterium]
AIHDEVSRAMLETSADPVDQIRTFMTAYVCVHARYPLMTTIAHSDLHALTEDSLATVIAIRKQTVDLLKSIIDRGSAMGVFHCEQPWLVVAAFAGMAVRTAAWYRPPGTPRTTLIDDYPAEVHRSLIPDDFTLDEVASTFADYAVAIVMGVTPQATPPSPFGGRSHG